MVEIVIKLDLAKKKKKKVVTREEKAWRGSNISYKNKKNAGI